MKILLSLCLALFSAASFADFIQPNLYNCSGPGVTVNYTTTSLAGPPILTFNIGRQTFSGQGSAITEETSVLGNLLTITRAAIPDLQTDTLTLLLPNINLNGFEASTEFNTVIFSTRTRTSIGGPALVEGVIQKNTPRFVNCTATVAVF
jgi:hypothetical protein